MPDSVSAWEHLCVSLATALPGLLLAIATLLTVLKNLRKSDDIHAKVNGPVAELVKQTSEVLDAYRKAVAPPIVGQVDDKTPEEARHSE